MAKITTRLSQESQELLDIAAQVRRLKEISMLAFGRDDGPFVLHAERAVNAAYMAEYLSFRQLRRTKLCVSEAFDLLFESYFRGEVVESIVLDKFDEAGELYLSPEDIASGVGAEALVRKRLELKGES